MIGRRIAHYRVEERLGAGGMGEVYRATDLALGRAVALKVLPERFDPALRARLLREAQASGRLQHPAIASLIESGEDDGVSFIAMEFVPGENLRARLARGALPLAEALGIATSVLEALAHAHAAGIVHRDIKPENIAVPEPSRAKVLDFGLARQVSEPGTETPTRTALTHAGGILGTFGYMAPEQLHGTEADGRADLFAVGAVLYEMLAGRPAFGGATPAARIAATLASDPGPLTGVAEPLNAVVARSLAKERDRRYATAREFLLDLHAASEGEAVSSLPDTVAVADFTNLSGDPADSWIGGACAETLATDLARTGGLRPVPRPTVAAAVAETGSYAHRLGLRLACRWTVMGTYQRVGPSLRILMKVTEGATGRVLADEKVDGTMDALFAMQDRLAEIARAAMPVGSGVASASARVRPDLDAYECHARGREEWLRMEKGSFDRASDLFEQAIAREPGYADALVGLAMVHDMRFTFTTDRAELEEAAALARRAIEVAPAHGEAHIWLAYALWRLGALDEALALLAEAMSLAPENGYPPYFSACILTEKARHADGMVLFQRAVTLMPGFGFAWLGLGAAHMELRAFEEALWCLRKAVSLERVGRHATVGASGVVAECLRRSGHPDEARAEAMSGLAVAEATDHMYRDTFRAMCLCSLGRAALDQKDPEAAKAAFRQAETHLRGRTRTLGGGALHAQSLAGLAWAEGDDAMLTEAIALFESRGAMNWSWFWLCDAGTTAGDLSRAARALGRPDLAARVEEGFNSLPGH